MTDASWFGGGHYFLYGRFIPGGIATPEGFDGCGPPRLEPACWRGALALPLEVKFTRIRVRCVPVAIACVEALCCSDLSIESYCLVAMSTTRGEDLSGRESQSWPITVSQRWAIDRAPAGP